MQRLIMKPDEIKEMIKEYYSKTLGIQNAEVVISNKSEMVGYETQSYSACITTIKVKFKRLILNAERTVEQIIDMDTIKEVIETGLNQNNLKLIDFKFDNGINSEWEGYGMSEHKVEKAYFKGIEISYTETKIPKKILN